MYNANVTLGDTVTVMKAKAIQLEKVVLALPYPLPLDEGYFSIILDNRPLIKGDTVAVPYFGHMLPLKVVDVEPDGTVIVT
jgi:hypothetical protein